MESYKKIIPCLDVKDGRVVKGINFVNFKDAGDPAEVAACYNKAGADELVFLDITASIEGRDTIVELVKKVAANVTIPFVVGGGIRTLEDIERILNAGATKISINSAALKRPQLVEEASKKFGSEKIVVAIDVVKTDNNGYNVLINGGKEKLNKDPVAWAKEVEKLGAGELLVTSLDCDGAKTGYDLEITSAIAKAVKIPVTASGGAGTKEHFYEAFTIGMAQNALAASLFHFKEVDIFELKQFLKDRGINVNVQ